MGYGMYTGTSDVIFYALLSSFLVIILWFDVLHKMYSDPNPQFIYPYLSLYCSSEECIEQIRELYSEGESDLALISEEMLDLSLIKGV